MRRYIPVYILFWQKFLDKQDLRDFTAVSPLNFLVLPLPLNKLSTGIKTSYTKKRDIMCGSKPRAHLLVPILFCVAVFFEKFLVFLEEPIFMYELERWMTAFFTDPVEKFLVFLIAKTSECFSTTSFPTETFWKSICFQLNFSNRLSKMELKIVQIWQQKPSMVPNLNEWCYLRFLFEELLQQQWVFQKSGNHIAVFSNLDSKVSDWEPNSVLKVFFGIASSPWMSYFASVLRECFSCLSVKTYWKSVTSQFVFRRNFCFYVGLSFHTR